MPIARAPKLVPNSSLWIEMPDMIGFIGVGTMGEPMCRNLARKSGATVLAADRDPPPRHMASEVTHCGEAGAGQTVKILNNMIIFQTGVALAEALTIARAHGVDGKVLFETLAKGSADSFALRNHGMKAMLPGVFPH